jgi:hypothetical protein
VISTETTVNRLVAGSNPARGAIQVNNLEDRFSAALFSRGTLGAVSDQPAWRTKKSHLRSMPRAPHILEVAVAAPLMAMKFVTPPR